jgi:hypothetical protein
LIRILEPSYLRVTGTPSSLLVENQVLMGEIMNMRITKTILACASLLTLTSGVPLMANDHDALKAALETKYQLTKTGIDRVRITQPGTVFILQKEGISGDLSSDATFLNNKVQDGQIAQASGFMAAMQNKKTSRNLKPGDKVYLFRLDIKDDQVWFFVITADTFDVNVQGSTRQIRYKAQLSFELGKEFMATATPEAVEKAIEAVVMPESEVKAASTKSVDLGQTPAQVEDAMGRPDKIVHLGAKMIYVYKDMKIVFVDEKVSDVQ